MLIKKTKDGSKYFIGCSGYPKVQYMMAARGAQQRG
jgi:ssDNA-binding Zn-finger/Zn-ribbon topoisomerase 1